MRLMNLTEEKKKVKQIFSLSERQVAVSNGTALQAGLLYADQGP